jgi:hypothetical protein
MVMLGDEALDWVVRAVLTMPLTVPKDAMDQAALLTVWEIVKVLSA